METILWAVDDSWGVRERKIQRRSVEEGRQSFSLGKSTVSGVLIRKRKAEYRRREYARSPGVRCYTVTVRRGG